MISLEELKKAQTLLKEWPKQNDEDDTKTNFIYRCSSVEEVKDLCQKQNADFQYALHRFYNFGTSKHSEWLFAKYGACPAEDFKNHDVDFYIATSEPVDLKICTLPKEWKGKPLVTIKQRAALIKWLYENASSESRQHFGNKVFIVCESQKAKCDFAQIEQKVMLFTAWAKWHGLTTIEVMDGICKRYVKAGLIYIENTA